MNSELEGFVVYKPDETKPAFISTRKASVGINNIAYKKLGTPQYVNVFVDEVGKRVMIKAAANNYDNRIKVVQDGNKTNMRLCYRGLAKKISDMFGLGTKLPGHIVGKDMMIFEAKGAEND